MLSMKLSHDPAISPLSIYPKEMKICPHKGLCLSVCSTLFIIASNWKQSNSSPIIESSPTIHEWVNKMWYIQTMEQHSDIERNELLIHGTIWMNLKIIMPNENMSTQMTDDIPYVSNNMKF